MKDRPGKYLNTILIQKPEIHRILKLLIMNMQIREHYRINNKRISLFIKGSRSIISWLILLTILLLIFGNLSGQDSLWVRKYQVGVYNQYDLRNSSENAITTHRVLADAFRKGVKPLMGDKLGNITYGIYNFASTYMLLVWSHEFGHSLRAEQVGGKFKIHNAELPIPYTTMHLPEGISLSNEALAVTGGFEVNYLTVRSLQREFISQNGTYNEDLSLGFVHRTMYILYTSLIVPIDPEDPEVWKDPPGDPANIALLTFKNYSGDQVFVGADSTVNPGLVKYYQQSAILGTFFNLLDPQFYREVGGAFGRSKPRKPIFIIGDYYTGWTYGTLFNTSPLGYELYMNNYIHVKGNMFTLYLKYGNPFQNLGLGLGWQDIIHHSKVHMSAFFDIWDQDIYGPGISGEVSADFRLIDKFGVHLNLGYKTRGYVLGKQINEGANLGFGLIYYASY